MGIAVGPFGVNAHLLHHLGHFGLDIGARKGRVVKNHRFFQNAGRAHARVERGVRVLKDHLHLAPEGQHLLG